MRLICAGAIAGLMFLAGLVASEAVSRGGYHEAPFIDTPYNVQLTLLAACAVLALLALAALQRAK
jgi:hypothetical protein